MKLNLKSLSLAAILAATTVASARANSNAPDNAPTDASTTPATAPAPAASPAETTPSAAAPAPVPVTLAQATAPTTPAPVTADATTNTVRDANAVVPLLVIEDAPLPDAIKQLARSAGLNYMLDPKITAPTEAGPRQQPMVSLRWENLTAEQALTAVLATYNLTMIEDPKSKIVRITIKDPAAPDPLTTKIIQLKYSDPTNMVLNVQGVLQDKRSKVLADPRTSQLVLVATEKEIPIVDELIARLDTQTKEVLIEAKLVELSKNPSTSKGIDWSGTLANQHVSFGNGSGYFTTPAAGTPAIAPTVTTVGTNVFTTSGSPATPPQLGLLNGIVGSPGLMVNTKSGFNPSTFFLNADGVSAVLSFLNSEADAKVLSTPRAVTLDNQEAVLSVTTAQPIFKTTAGTQGSPGGAEVTYTNLGTILRVTPRISANNTINLRVIPEVSSLGGTVTKTVSGLTSQADFFDVRKMDTRVLIPSGNTLVMGGLVNDSSTKGNTKVPFFGDLPLLGHAFRQESKSQNKRNLVIFITPTIVQNEDFQPTQTDFLKTKANDKPEAEFGPWDSGSPQDWSKLMHKQKPSDDSGNN